MFSAMEHGECQLEFLVVKIAALSGTGGTGEAKMVRKAARSGVPSRSSGGPLFRVADGGIGETTFFFKLVNLILDLAIKDIIGRST